MSNVQPIRARSASKPGPKIRAAEPRVPTTFRPIKSHRDRLEQCSERLGDVPLNDYVSWALAKAHGWAVPGYLQYIDKLVEDRELEAPEQLPLGFAMEA